MELQNQQNFQRKMLPCNRQDGIKAGLDIDG